MIKILEHGWHANASSGEGVSGTVGRGCQWLLLCSALQRWRLLRRWSTASIFQPSALRHAIFAVQGKNLDTVLGAHELN